MATKTHPKIRWLISVVLLAALSVSVWATGTYDDGDGSAGNPFQINTPAQMDEIGQHPEDWASCFILTADIDLSGYTGTDFHIIGNSTTDFNGVFDGNDHTISNFAYTTTGTDYIGLFGYVGTGAEIKNLGMTSVNINVGVGSDLVGGLVGVNSYGTVSKCYVKGTLTGGNYCSFLGGLVGENYHGTISDCHAAATVEAGDTDVGNMGGLVGRSSGTVSNSYATGDVTGGSYLGGLVGNGFFVAVSNCYATGSVTGRDELGGLVGRKTGETLLNCYSTGNVAGNDKVGGLLGRGGGTILNCYAAGSVSGSSDVGGFTGYDSSPSYTSCFWDSDIGPAQGIGNTTDPNVMGRTTAQMKSQSSFTDYGWDFVGETINGANDIWIILEGQDYPRLWWQYGYEAKIIFVDCNAVGASNGTSWTDAYNYLQDALALAVGGCEIRVASGTYKPDNGAGQTPGDREATFQLIDGVVLYGGYAGVNEPDPNARDVELYETVLSGDLASNDGPEFANNGENSYHVVTGSGTDGTAVLDGFTVTAGNADGSYPDNCGGGMYTSFGSPRVTNCAFSGNSASAGWLCGGGGMANEFNSNPTLDNCSFNGNTVISTDELSGGGGMFNYGNSNPLLTHCTFSENTVISIYEWTGGGGMYNYSSSPPVTNCTFGENSANNGGGIVNVYSSPTVTSCMFIGNFVFYAGGGLVNFIDSSPTVTDCMFIRNSAAFGGGMTNDGQNIECCPKLINCAFSGNFAQFNGGGVHNYINGKPTLTNCTFSGNRALDHGGAIHSEYKSDAMLANCILWGNEAPKGPQIAMRQNPDANASNVTVSYSDVQGGRAEVYLEGSCTLDWNDHNNITSDPLFLDPDGLDNEMGTEDDNLRLLFNSPCIDAGDNTADTDANTPGVQPLPLIDLDGDPRFADDPNVVDTGNGTPPIVDMGAYEGAKGTILFVLSANSVTIPEGQTATFEVTLGMDPQETVEVTVARQSGDPNITVQSGALLTFNSSDYYLPQTVTLAADEDADYLHGTAVISVTVAGVVSTYLTAIEGDNEDAPPILFVDLQASGANDGNSWTDAFRDLQEALNIARYAPDVEQIWVATGTYTPAAPLGDRTATFELINGVAIYGGFPSGGGEWEDRDPNTNETILSGDLNGNDQADANNDDNSYHVVTGSGTDGTAVIDGFTITAGNATGPATHNSGGGMYNEFGSPSVTSCEFRGNSAGFSGGMYNYSGSPIVTSCTFHGNSADAWGGGMYNYLSSATLSDCIFSGNSAGGFIDRYGGAMCCSSSNITLTDVTFASGNIPDAVWMGYGSVQVNGTVQIVDSNWVGNNLELNGDGTLQIQSGVTLYLDNCQVRCDIAGPGNIFVAFGKELIIEQDATINLWHESDPNGQIICDGLLRLREFAAVRNAQVYVNRASFEDDAIIENSVVTAEAGAPYGQFFIEDNVRLWLDRIASDGDRYLDLDPTEFDCNNIHVGRIDVNITEGVGGTHGGLFELRGKPNLASIISCDPNNEFFCEANTIPAFDANNWAIYRLELIADAKLNLTNRFDFHTPYDSGGEDEALYVKQLILGPDSVLNTAFNHLCYETLTMDPTAQVVNIPLLGFSLVNISLNDENDYLTRVKHNNYVDAEAPDYDRIHVTRIEGNEPDPNGMMRMCNLVDQDTEQLVNARAKGLFAKASEDQVLIQFEYLFCDPNGRGELVVYLSDTPEILDHNDPLRDVHYLEVARILPPPVGRPGSAGSGRFAVFHDEVSAGNLNFIRGTRMELELIGPEGTCILINNWDPCIRCSSTCMDVAGRNDGRINAVDFLAIMGELGNLICNVEWMAGALPTALCVDGPYSQDGIVTIHDAMAIDWREAGNLCAPSLDSALSPEYSPTSVGTSLAKCQPPLLVAGKRYDPGDGDVNSFLSDRLFGLDEEGNSVGEAVVREFDRLNGRLIRDYEGEIYMLNLRDGLVRLSDGNSVIPERKFEDVTEPRHGQLADVYVGQEASPSMWERNPILDAAFDRYGYVYVVPVLVEPDGKPKYKTAAKLELDPGSTPPYSIVRLYDGLVEPNDNINTFGLRELEVDYDGNLFISKLHYYYESDAVRYYHDSDVLLVYDTDTGEQKQHMYLANPNGDGNSVFAPSAMHVSDTTGQLYLGSSLCEPNADSTSLYVISREGLLQSPNDPNNVQTIEIGGMGHITGITECPETGTVWAVGFSIPNLPSDDDIQNESVLNEIPFYQPYFAKIPVGDEGPIEAICLSDYSDPNFSLALPLSIVWTDARIDSIDLAIFAEHWQETECNEPDWCNGADLDESSIVDYNDLGILTRNWLEAGCLE
jgi:predicted outer membrane repeat protein